MKNAVYNMGFFFKEAKTLFKLDLMSNILSIVSIGLVFFILALVISGWDIVSFTIDIIRNEAEINLYYKKGINDDEIQQLVDNIKAIEGVSHIEFVDEEEAYLRMKDILGEEAYILDLFEDNPFSSFIEISINIDESDNILDKLSSLENVEYIRDNKSVIDKLQNIVSISEFIGILSVIAVAALTLTVVSHIIRQGIHNNRDEINTLNLLGAPKFFINFPFILEGLFLTLSGGIIASSILLLVLKYGYGQVKKAIPFIPLPSSESIMFNSIIFVIIASGLLGVVGSAIGVVRERN